MLGARAAAVSRGVEGIARGGGSHAAIDRAPVSLRAGMEGAGRDRTGIARQPAREPLRPDAPTAQTLGRPSLPASPSQVSAGESLLLSSQSMGVARRPRAAGPDRDRQQPGRERHPPLRYRKEELALYRTPRRRRPIGNSLLDHRLLPAPRHQPARLPARRPHQAADN